MRSSDATENSPADEIDLGPLLRFVLRNWLVIAACIVLGGGIGWGSSFFFRPVYRATALLAPVHPSTAASRMEGLANVIGEVGSLVGLEGSPKTDEMQEAMATLGSRILTEGYIRQNRLIPILYQDYWDAEHDRYVIPWWKFWVDDPTLQSSAARFDRKYRHIVENKKTGMVELSVDWRDPVLAAKWVNELAQGTNSYLRQRAIDRGSRSLAYLNGELEHTSVVELRQALYRLVESELKNIMTAQGNEEYAFRIVDPAIPPEKRYFPKRKVFLSLGALAGLLVGLAWAWLDLTRWVIRMHARWESSRSARLAE